MDFFIKCVVLMMVLTFGPVICYLLLGVIIAFVAAIAGKDKVE